MGGLLESTLVRGLGVLNGKPQAAASLSQQQCLRRRVSESESAMHMGQDSLHWYPRIACDLSDRQVGHASGLCHSFWHASGVVKMSELSCMLWALPDLLADRAWSDCTLPQVGGHHCLHRGQLAGAHGCPRQHLRLMYHAVLLSHSMKLIWVRMPRRVTGQGGVKQAPGRTSNPAKRLNCSPALWELYAACLAAERTSELGLLCDTL